MNIVVTDIENQELFSCGIEDIDKAFQFARQMEEMDIEVKIMAPSLPETLINALGSSAEDCEKLKCAIDREISEHL
jgi:hypothetical protein